MLFVEKCYRTGRAIEGKPPRHIVIKVEKFEDKINIMKKKREALKNEKIFLNDDLTPLDLMTRNDLQPVIAKIKEEKKRWHFRNGKLWIEGKEFIGPPGLG